MRLAQNSALRALRLVFRFGQCAATESPLGLPEASEPCHISISHESLLSAEHYNALAARVTAQARHNLLRLLRVVQGASHGQSDDNQPAVHQRDAQLALRTDRSGWQEIPEADLEDLQRILEEVTIDPSRSDPPLVDPLEWPDLDLSTIQEAVEQGRLWKIACQHYRSDDGPTERTVQLRTSCPP
jgi:hypothetical protein